MSLPRAKSSNSFRFASQQFDDALVDTVLGQQSVHLHRTHLTHPVRPRDRLRLDGRLELRLAEDDHRRGLDVEPDTAGHDLRHENGSVLCRRELVHHALSLVGADRTGERPEDRPRQGLRHQIEDAAEVGEDNDLPLVFLRLADELDKPPQLLPISRPGASPPDASP